MKKAIDKGLLSNIMRHTDAHNRVREEREMWRQYEGDIRNPRRRRSLERTRPSRSRRRSYSDSPRRRRSRSRSRKRDEPSFYWTRELMKMEEEDPTRWGHSGYKELHPEEFGSKDKREDVEIDNKSSKKRKKKKKEKKRKKKSSGKRKKRNVDYDTDSDSTSSSSSSNSHTM
eukprot:m.47805 g.47805  ORF g.47805 m.47805 type:complete len:172 (+) comp33826_c0_seq5:32-547(+)